MWRFARLDYRVRRAPASLLEVVGLALVGLPHLHRRSPDFHGPGHGARGMTLLKNAAAGIGLKG